MNISAPFIIRAIATSLLMFALFLAGILSYGLLPVSSLPEVDYPTMRVVTFYPGASPDVMTSSVTAPLESQFGQMPGLAQMTSSSSSGASVITLQFVLSMTLDVAEQEVQAAINAASNFLPAGLPNPPIYSKVNPADTPILTFALTSKILPLTQIEDYAESRLAQKISQQSGVGLVTLSGGQRPAVRVQANPNALAAYGLSLESLRSAVTAGNVNGAKGSFDGPQLSYMINANDQLMQAQDYRSLVVAYKDGAPVRVGDVANVIDGAENNMLAAWMNETPAIIMNIQRQPGANVIQVVDGIKKMLPQLQKSLPQAINLELLTDRTYSIRESVRGVQYELILAVVLVVLVIYLFLLNISATIIPSIAVPISLIGTLGLMYLWGFSLNNLTLMALTIASGFVVDDAIVMIENITRYLEEGETPLNAALKGAKQISFTILSLTFSLIAVLIPLLFMKDIVGRLFREFALTLSIVIFISAFVSLTLTPMLCARMLRPKKSRQGAISRQLANIFTSVAHFYERTLSNVLSKQELMLIVFLITLGLTLFLFFIIPKGFFPAQDTGVIQGITEASQSISFPAMADRQQAVAKVILAHPAVQNLSSFIGIDGTNTTLNSGRMQITLKPLAHRNVSVGQVINDLTHKLANVPGITLYMQPSADLTIDTTTSRTQYQLSLSSPDANFLSSWSAKILAKLRTLPDIMDVATDEQNGGQQIYITIDRETASRLGISAQTIDDNLYDAYGQRQVSIIFTQRNQYRVILEVMQNLKKDKNQLSNIYLPATLENIDSQTKTLTTTQGGAVPLKAISKVSQKLAPIVIHRLGQFPATTISFNLASHAALGNAMQAIDAAKQALAIPDSVDMQYQGSAKIFQNAMQNEFWLLAAAIITVYIILGVLYESYIHPITILSVLPSATLGCLLGLLLFRLDLSVIALIGIILLIGIVMKNAIMMIDFALEQERVYKKAPYDAIYDAALLRFRPILMTTCAALLSAVPLAFGTGVGSELRQPLGIVIIGGLIISQLLTLYTTPVIYLFFDKLSRRFLKRSAAGGLIEEPSI